MSSIVRGRVLAPSVEEIRSGSPVTGATQATIADGLNGLAGIYAASWHCAHVTQPIETIASRVTGWVHETDGVSQTVYTDLHVGAMEDALVVAVLVSAYARGGTSTPRVVVDMLNGSGVVIDVGIAWDRDSGTLAAREDGDNGVYRYIVPTWQVAQPTRRPGLATAGSPSAPRPLEALTAAGDVRGQYATLRCVTTSARVHAVAWVPVWRVTI